MIKNNIIKISTFGCRKKPYFQSLGYDITGDFIYIDIKHLNIGSRELIDVICDYCNNIVNITYKEYLRNLNINNINKYACCKKCGSEKAKETCLEKYGVESHMILDSYKEQVKETNLIKYGVEYLQQSYEFREKSKKTLMDKYGVDHISKTTYFKKRFKETCLNNNGFEYPMQSDVIKEKSKNTSIERYGVDNPSKSNVIKEKVKQTNLLRYGNEHYMLSDDFILKSKNTLFERYGVYNPMCSNIIKYRIKETNLSRYGVEFPIQSDAIKEKSKNTSIERYGVDNPSKSDVIKNKVKETCLTKYGNKHYILSDDFILKSKNTLFERYGVYNPMSSDIIKHRIKETNLLRYGVEYPMQSEIVKEKSKSTSIERYGVDNPMQYDLIKNKVKETNLLRYGSEHYMSSDDFLLKSTKTLFERYGVYNPMSSDIIKHRIKETNLLRYGVEYPMQSEIVKEKSKNTSIERYGVDNPSKSDVIKNKVKETCLAKYDSEHYMSSDDFLLKSKTTLYEKYLVDHISKSESFRKNRFSISSDINYIKYKDNSISCLKCDLCNSEYDIHVDNYIKRTKSNLPLCTLCYPIGNKISIKEKQLFEFIKDNYNGEIIQSYRNGLEIDIYLPELKLGFEFNGLYWHSEQFKEKNYHLNKTNFFKDKGVHIMHIWEDDWTFKEDIIKSQVRNLLGHSINKIYARKCVIKELKSVTDFLNANHVQGVDRSVYKIGLYYNDELVSVMTFNRLEGRNKMEEGGYNLSRFCNLLNTNVIGGASKMLTYFIKKYNAKRVISYADKDWSVGNLYYTLGFENISEGKPDYKYIVDNIRKHKQNFKKSNLKLENDITESKYMRDKEIYKIYDCGKIKFEKLIYT